MKGVPERLTRTQQAKVPQKPIQRRTSRTEPPSLKPNGKRHQELSVGQLLEFERKGHLTIRAQVPAGEVTALGDSLQKHLAERLPAALEHRRRVLCPELPAARLAAEKDTAAAIRLLDGCSAEPVGFLQIFNCHRDSAEVRGFLRCSGLGAAAAALLGARRVRLYQDCLFWKQAGFAETNWHSDLRMSPLDTIDFVTAWLPIQRPIQADGDSGLTFASGSHRDFALPFWHDLRSMDLRGRGYPLHSTGRMELGDVSWHHGFTLHSSARQPPGTPDRVALSISFFADGARMLDRRKSSVRKEMLQDEDLESFRAWIEEVPGGKAARHKLLPLMWPECRL